MDRESKPSRRDILGTGLKLTFGAAGVVIVGRPFLPAVGDMIQSTTQNISKPDKNTLAAQQLCRAVRAKESFTLKDPGPVLLNYEISEDTYKRGLPSADPASSELRGQLHQGDVVRESFYVTADANGDWYVVFDSNCNPNFYFSVPVNQ